ncbi:MAG: hypothetical protein ABJE95_06035 [Byssovorax sp.]
MASRAPRRCFATPFVVTLAVLPALPGCVESPAPQPPGSMNPPMPTGESTPPTPPTAPPPPPTATPTTGVSVRTPFLNPPRPVVSGSASPDPTPRPPREWTIIKVGTSCEIVHSVQCPPNVKCNPPPPRRIACPANVDFSTPRHFTEIVGSSECVVARESAPCKPGTTCNPPAPQRVPCPE